MIFWHRRSARPPPPEKKANPRLLKLQAAKEILAEIFHARSEDIEEMIQSRLEDRSRTNEQAPIYSELWPEAFCLDE